MTSPVIVLAVLAILGYLHLAEANPVQKSVASCSILVHGGLAEPQPLIMWPGFNGGYAIPQEAGTGSIILSAGESVRVNCLGTSNSLIIDTDEPYEPVSDVNVTCVSETNFSIDGLGITVSFDKIGCSSYPTHTARRTGVPCPNGEICEIGFDLGDDDFQNLMTFCHDDVNQNTILAHAKVPAAIDSLQRSFPRPGFVKGIFYTGVSMASIYTRVNQRATLAKILGSEELALEYLPTTGTFYWARGHLAAKTDFIFGSHQRSTFYYLNTVPMWQNVNAGNWGTMEANVRSMATARSVDLDIWTGSLGILTLADVDEVEQEVHLYVDDNNNKAVPVPKILFKIIHDDISGQGVVFVTVNNPYLEKLTNDTVVCTDVCDRITYVTWDPTSSTKGLSYCCEVDDFRKVFPDLPAFTTTGLLE